MDLLRRAVGPIALTWLFCHAATLTVATSVLVSGVGERAAECECAQGDHAYCPMHHKPAPGSKACVMGSSSDAHAAILTVFFGAVGLIAPPMPAVATPAVAAHLAPDATTPSLRASAPDPPPPRT